MVHTFQIGMSEVCWIVHECLHFKGQVRVLSSTISNLHTYLLSLDSWRVMYDVVYTVNPKKVSVRLYQYKIRYILLEKVCKCYISNISSQYDPSYFLALVNLIPLWPFWTEIECTYSAYCSAQMAHKPVYTSSAKQITDTSSLLSKYINCKIATR